MPNPPTQPPDTGPRRPPPPPGSPLRAILVGLAVDIGGSSFIGVLLSVGYALSLTASGMSTDDVKEAMRHIPPTSLVAILGTVLGAACSVAGGYVCARIVQRDEWRVGGTMALLSGLCNLLLGSPDTPADMTFLFFASTVACVLLGVKYGVARNRPAARTSREPKP